jgi:putative FmdB family regulatory protein
MPLYEYKCADGHTHQRLRKMAERDEPCTCLECDLPAEPIISAPHVPPDGVYSYAPNIGTAKDFERKQAKMERMAEHKKDTGEVKLVDEV